MNAVYAIAGALVLSVVSILVLREAKVLAMGLAGGAGAAGARPRVVAEDASGSEGRE